MTGFPLQSFFVGSMIEGSRVLQMMIIVLSDDEKKDYYYLYNGDNYM